MSSEISISGQSVAASTFLTSALIFGTVAGLELQGQHIGFERLADPAELDLFELLYLVVDFRFGLTVGDQDGYARLMHEGLLMPVHDLLVADQEAIGARCRLVTGLMGGARASSSSALTSGDM